MKHENKEYQVLKFEMHMYQVQMQEINNDKP